MASLPPDPPASDTDAPAPIAADTPAPAVKPLSCPNCGGTVELRAAGYTVSVVCQYCSSLLDVTHPDVMVIKRYQEAAAELEIPLGTRGVLKGVEWEAIGWLARSEGGAYPWEEYLLFNPYHGYRWLVTDGRGWTFGTMLTRLPGSSYQGMTLDDQAYQPFFAEGRAQVDRVLGEFYWRVAVGETVRTSDYVRPGFMLSFEGSGDEANWTLGELLDPGEMRGAFGVGAPPRSWPPLPHQPSPYGGIASSAFKFAGLAVLAILLLTMVFGSSRELMRQSVTVEPDAQAKSVTLGPLTLDRAWQAVTISAHAPALDNAWIDLDYALVDRATQASYEAYGAAERYSGSDSDGAWTEGDRSATTKMAMLPAGNYDLVVDLAGHNWQPGGGAVDVEIVVARGARFWSNIVLAIILILLPAIWLFWRHLRFEQARQYASDLGPTGVARLFQSSGDDDDD